MFLVGLKNFNEDIRSIVPELEKDLNLLEGKLQKILESFNHSGVYLLPKGTLENYFVKYLGNPFIIPPLMYLLPRFPRSPNLTTTVSYPPSLPPCIVVGIK